MLSPILEISGTGDRSEPQYRNQTWCPCIDSSTTLQGVGEFSFLVNIKGRPFMCAL